MCSLFMFKEYFTIWENIYICILLYWYLFIHFISFRSTASSLFIHDPASFAEEIYVWILGLLRQRIERRICGVH